MSMKIKRVQQMDGMPGSSAIPASQIQVDNAELTRQFQEWEIINIVPMAQDVKEQLCAQPQYVETPHGKRYHRLRVQMC